MTFSSLQRKEMLNKLRTEHFDLVVIGGGITGAGIALDAAARGMKTAVLEMQDFAAGTSSRSTKLVHGGLRYLKQFEVKMVAEVGKERAIVYENGPHVTTPEWMLLPMHKGGTFGKFSTSIGLRVYDFLAGVKKSERRKMLSAEHTLEKEPLVKKEGLVGGGYYVEYRTDDARLTIEVMKKAVEKGTAAVNYVKAEEFIYEGQTVIGVRAKDVFTGEVLNIRAKKVANAAGPWVDEVRKKDHTVNNKHLRLTKGTHIVIDQSKFSLKQAVYFDSPDGRMIFAIPRDGKAYVGTTDTFYDQDKASPKMLAEDREYLLSAIRYMFPKVQVDASDVESSWVGVRPLIYEEGKDPSEISRKDEIWEGESGLITIAGGKLTGYRKMAETVVDLVSKRLKDETGAVFKESQTLHLPISGGDVGGADQFTSFVERKGKEAVSFGLTKQEGESLARMYGSNVDQLFALAKQEAPARLPKKLYVQLMYAITYEMAVKPVDFFIRRTGDLFFRIDEVVRYKEQVIQLMANVFQWEPSIKAAYQAEVEREIKDAQVPVDIQ
ncbi:FAD-dependent oxidoreductase [Bacillus aerolatus]|uniref:Glycerol-3-phosphate dehydrogenase n=1 Tax=Bacillus aerolatus TaxID=2653354 RepID=A0A6I1FPF6_9BACI|nr:FAD-dependent oxidoreductase [Bacillus aerolatus]KAB7708306.1 FAD-dependent oxidoreductase [Bacillus aerolatus]